MLHRHLLAVVLTGIAASDIGAQDASGRVDRYVQTFATAGQFSGAVLVARGRDVVLERTYGTPKSLFAVASITKVMTGIIVRTLVERGRLNLDDPVSKWIPDFPNGSRIRVAHLLGHRSGIPHRVTQLADEQTRQSATSMAEKIGQAPLAFEPGAQRLYSSAGYSVLARVLELASGKSYAKLLTEVVLLPSGASTAIDATDPAIAGKSLARGHFWTVDGPADAPSKDLSFLVGAGSMWGTARDLFHIARRVADGTFGAAAAGARNDDGSLSWMGFSNGYSALVSYSPRTDVTVVVLSNLLTGAADLIARDAAALVRGDTVAPPNPPRIAGVRLSEAQRADIEGLYNFGGSRQALRFISPTAALMGGEYLLITTGEHTMFAPQNYLTYNIVSDSTGRITALAPDGGGPYTIARVRE